MQRRRTQALRGTSLGLRRNELPEELLSHIWKSSGVVRGDLYNVDKNCVMGGGHHPRLPVCSPSRQRAASSCPRQSRREGRRRDGIHERRVGIQGALQRLARNKVDYSILEASRHVPKKQITSRQEDLVRIAFDLGYSSFRNR